MNCLHFLANKIPIYTTYKEFKGKQLAQLATLLHTPFLSLQGLCLGVFMVSLAPKNWWQGLLLRLYFQTGFYKTYYYGELAAQWVQTQTSQVIVWDTQKPPQPQIFTARSEISFVQFIRLHFYIACLSRVKPEKISQLYDDILAAYYFPSEDTPYSDELQQAHRQRFATLHPKLKENLVKHIYQEFMKLIKSYKNVFPDTQKEGNSPTPQNIQSQWIEVARARVESITDIEKILHFSARWVLYDTDKAIQEYQEQKDKIENGKGN